MFSFLVCEKIFHIFCENFAKFILNFAKISRNLLGISQKSTMLFSQNFAKFKIFSSKFRVSLFLKCCFVATLSISLFFLSSPFPLTSFFLFRTSCFLPLLTSFSHSLLPICYFSLLYPFALSPPPLSLPLIPPCLIFLHSPIPYHFFFPTYPSPNLSPPLLPTVLILPFLSSFFLSPSHFLPSPFLLLHPPISLPHFLRLVLFLATNQNKRIRGNEPSAK